MISFAGIPIHSNPNGEVERILASWWQREGIREFERSDSVLGGILHLPLPALPIPRCPRVSVLEWPNRASCWATFHAIICGDEFNQLAGLEEQTGVLVIGDGRNSITTTLTMLPPRTIGRHAGSELYFLTLVDERFFWWQSVVSAPTAPASWSALLLALLNAVGVADPTLPSIASAYGTPDANRWNVGFKALPLLIDAICATVGLQLTRGLDGSVALVSAASAIAADQAQWNTCASECLIGGAAPLSQSLQSLPATVRIVFPGANAQAAEATVDVTLASLSLVPFAGVTGIAGAVAFVGADLIATASSASRTTYAEQAASDYYLWAIPATEATFRGVQNWRPTGLEERIEWAHRETILTHVFRRPTADRNLYTSSPFASSSGGAQAYTTNYGPPNTDYIEIPTSGHSPTAGITYTGTPLQPANGLVQGWVTGTTQSFSGDKTFGGNVTILGALSVDAGLLGGALGTADVSSGRDLSASRDVIAGRNVNAGNSVEATISLIAPITYSSLQGDTATINNLWFGSTFHVYKTTGIPLGGSSTLPILEIQGPNPSVVDLASGSFTVSNGDVIAGFGIRGQIVYAANYFECEETPGISATIIDASGNTCTFLGGILVSVTPPAGP